MSKTPDITSGPPHTFGWIRRPELDTDTGKAWERPDGKIWLHPRGAPDPLFFRMKRKREK
jgi:hypothetical protein